MSRKYKIKYNVISIRIFECPLMVSAKLSRSNTNSNTLLNSCVCLDDYFALFKRHCGLSKSYKLLV
ncbi:hypothetical protein BpHYR1_028345 [Brachionus plicatilis]|uniref:Uncharacterized protein n=1 Tax=Brachionus plicatilis TaxID=10195 RepID=A0A3M7P9S1_BRAPC|nr:hypothetical protein BpHYR1_028345 [Brachionus plicatilis]